MGVVVALEGLDDDHAPAAARTGRPPVWWGSSIGIIGSADFRLGRGEKHAGAGDICRAAGAGKQSIVSDAMEAHGQHVKQEAANEFIWIERHGPITLVTAATVVLVAERHTRAIERGNDARAPPSAASTSGAQTP